MRVGEEKEKKEGRKHTEEREVQSTCFVRLICKIVQINV